MGRSTEPYRSNTKMEDIMSSSLSRKTIVINTVNDMKAAINIVKEGTIMEICKYVVMIARGSGLDSNLVDTHIDICPECIDNKKIKGWSGCGEKEEFLKKSQSCLNKDKMAKMIMDLYNHAMKCDECLYAILLARQQSIFSTMSNSKSLKVLSDMFVERNVRKN